MALATPTHRVRRTVTCFAAALATIPTSEINSFAQQPNATAKPAADARLVEIDHPGAGTPMVQIALPAGMFADLRGLVDATLTGAIEALRADAGDGEDRAAPQLAAEHLTSVRDLTQILEGAVEEVRVEIYSEDASVAAGPTAAYYARKLSAVGWDQVVRARERDQSAHVFVLREDGALRGVFVVAGERGATVLVNVACDVSPDRLQELSRRVTTLWLNAGGRAQLQQAIEHMPR